MWRAIVGILAVWQLIIAPTSASRPVILVHGLLSSALHMNDLAAMIKDKHPDTDVHNIDAYSDGESLARMWEQVKGLHDIIAPIAAAATDGINLICFSQGGLVCRGLLQAYPDHNVRTFISLASPLAGQYGYTGVGRVFPVLSGEDIYKICYTTKGQEISICNYWNDPLHQDLYRAFSSFLYPLFYPIPSDSASERSYSDPHYMDSYTEHSNVLNPLAYKSNFEKLDNLVLVGGPDDGIITPWQSSHFGFYDEHLIVQEYRKQQFYTEDTFGLRTLDETGRLHIHNVPGMPHYDFKNNRTVFDCCIEPWIK